MECTRLLVSCRPKSALKACSPLNNDCAEVNFNICRREVLMPQWCFVPLVSPSSRIATTIAMHFISSIEAVISSPKTGWQCLHRLQSDCLNIFHSWKLYAEAPEITHPHLRIASYPCLSRMFLLQHISRPASWVRKLRFIENSWAIKDICSCTTDTVIHRLCLWVRVISFGLSDIAKDSLDACLIFWAPLHINCCHPPFPLPSRALLSKVYTFAIIAHLNNGYTAGDSCVPK